MRILMVSAEYPPMMGGVGDYTRRLNGALTQQGHEVAVVTGNQGQAYRDAARIYPVRVQRWDRSCIETIRQVIAKLQPNIVHIQYQTGAYGMNVAINTLPRKLSYERKNGLKVVTTAHDLLPPYLFPKAGPLREWYTKRIIRDADAAIMTNAGDYHRVMNERAGIWNPRTMFIPIGANVTPAPPRYYERSLWRERFEIQSGGMLLAYFGLLTQTKGLEVIVDAMQQLPDTTRLVMIGGAGDSEADQGYAQQLKQKISRAGLDQRIIITGYTEPADVSAYLMAADAVVLPFNDGYSYRRGSLITALAHQVPVITTRAPAGMAQDPLPELIHEKHALLIEPQQVGQLVAAVQRIQQEPELAFMISRQGRALTDLFSWEHIVQQHEELYNSLLG
jgi:glycosyltransferase involved in cell wall biosynthesis